VGKRSLDLSSIIDTLFSPLHMVLFWQSFFISSSPGSCRYLLGIQTETEIVAILVIKRSTNVKMLISFYCDDWSINQL